MHVQDAFAIVIFVVVAGGALIAVIMFAGAGKLYDQIGHGWLSLGDDEPLPRPAGSAAATREREDEIRQLLSARNEHRRRRGEELIDVEEELQRLLAPAVDPALRDEIRQMVLARNDRRVRAGKQPLDVDAEVERQMRELAG